MKAAIYKFVVCKYILAQLWLLNQAIDMSSWVFDEVYFISETFRIHAMTDGAVRIEEWLLDWLEARIGCVMQALDQFNGDVDMEA